MSARSIDQTITPDVSEGIALRALGFLSGRNCDFDRCIARSGLSATAFRQSPIAREIMVATLDYLLSDDKTLNAFSARTSLPAEFAYTARRVLGRGERIRTSGF